MATEVGNTLEPSGVSGSGLYGVDTASIKEYKASESLIRDDDKEILRLSIQGFNLSGSGFSCWEDVVIYRAGHRKVEIQSLDNLDSPPDREKGRSFVIDLDYAVWLPLYIYINRPNFRCIFQKHEQGSIYWLSFKTMLDVFKFQEVFTTFSVQTHIPDVRVCLRPMRRNTLLDAVVVRTAIQLWRKVPNRYESLVRTHDSPRTESHLPKTGAKGGSPERGEFSTELDTTTASNMGPEFVNGSVMKRHASSLLVFSGYRSWTSPRIGERINRILLDGRISIDTQCRCGRSKGSCQHITLVEDRAKTSSILANRSSATAWGAVRSNALGLTVMGSDVQASRLSEIDTSISQELLGVELEFRTVKDKMEFEATFDVLQHQHEALHRTEMHDSDNPTLRELRSLRRYRSAAFDARAGIFGIVSDGSSTEEETMQPSLRHKSIPKDDMRSKDGSKITKPFSDLPTRSREGSKITTPFSDFTIRSKESSNPFLDLTMRSKERSKIITPFSNFTMRSKEGSNPFLDLTMRSKKRSKIIKPFSDLTMRSKERSKTTAPFSNFTMRSKEGSNPFLDLTMRSKKRSKIIKPFSDLTMRSKERSKTTAPFLDLPMRSKEGSKITSLLPLPTFESKLSVSSISKTSGCEKQGSTSETQVNRKIRRVSIETSAKQEQWRRRICQRIIVFMLWKREQDVCLPNELWSSPASFDFISVMEISPFDKIKGLFEIYSGMEWNWWPFDPTAKPLESGKVRIRWQCACGDQRWTDASRYLAQKCQALVNENTIAGHERGDATSQSAGSAASHSQSGSVVPGSFPSDTSQAIEDTSNTCSEAQASHNQTTYKDSNSKGLYVLFCIYQQSQILHSQIVATKCQNDEAFFENLRQEYRRLRGFFRFWFSPFQFSHCDFVKFTRFYVNELAKVGHSLPIDLVYQYNPRPPGPHEDPPISPHEFRRRFYTHFTNPCGRDEALVRIPKRQKRFQINLHVDGREDMWGLHVELQPCFLVVLMWQIAITGGGWAFMGWWLSRHQGDLQDAAMPITIIVTAMMALWAPIGKGMRETL